MTDCWGISFHIDMRQCDGNLIHSKENLEKWVKQFVIDIEMKAYGEPQIVWFGEKDSNKEGYSVVQLIETSNIILHCNKSDNSSYLDLFTCKVLPNLEEKITKNIFDWFKPSHITLEKLYRQA